MGLSTKNTHKKLSSSLRVVHGHDNIYNLLLFISILAFKIVGYCLLGFQIYDPESPDNTCTPWDYYKMLE